MLIANYKFKQSELYTIGRLILSAILKPTILPRFSAFKGKYTAPWVADRLLQIDNAEDQPDEETRNAVHEIARGQLLEYVEDALIAFRSLERYILEVFPPLAQKASIESAGGTKYSDAADSDFDACQQMLNSAVNFIVANEATLSNGGLNMPAGFRGDTETLLANFQAKHTEFLNSEAGSEIQTEEKIASNNAIYDVIISTINGDAQVIYHLPTEDAIRRQFVLEHQLFLVRGAGVAGIRLHVTDSVTGADVEGAAFAIPSEEVEELTNATGRVLVLQLATGEYFVKVTKPGYNEFTATVTVEVGTVKRLNVQLTPV